jgi:hypothetical protein
MDTKLNLSDDNMQLLMQKLTLSDDIIQMLMQCVETSKRKLHINELARINYRKHKEANPLPPKPRGRKPIVKPIIVKKPVGRPVKNTPQSIVSLQNILNNLSNTETKYDELEAVEAVEAEIKCILSDTETKNNEPEAETNCILSDTETTYNESDAEIEQLSRLHRNKIHSIRYRKE